jgi:hypothetical protein
LDTGFTEPSERTSRATRETNGFSVHPMGEKLRGAVEEKG